MKQQLTKYEIRLEMLKECYQKIESFKLEIDLPEDLLNSLVGSYDNLQNDHKLTSIIKESFFISRELIDFVISKLAYEFKGTISNDFTKFMTGLANGNYLELNNSCINYLSQPSIVRGLIMIRTIRNKMKKDLDLTFHSKNQKELEITLEVDIPKKLRDDITKFDEIMNIKNRDLVTDQSELKTISYTLFPHNLINDFIVVFDKIKHECSMK